MSNSDDYEEQATTTSAPSIGSLRFNLEKQQMAGLLMVTGVCALIQPLVPISATINIDPTPTSGIAFSSLFGGVCVVATGVLSILIGYSELVHPGSGHKYITLFSCIFMQSS